jgi:hypothetical protein
MPRFIPPKLLFGPYRVPKLRRGDRAFCLVRDYPVVILGMSDAPISWPRCRPLEPPRMGTGLLIEDELERAVRNEAAMAVAYWWGVHESTVLNWRKALGVNRKNNEGTHRLVLGAIQKTLDARFGDGGSSPFPALGRPAVWTPEEMALLGALSDAEVARRTGRSRAAVMKKRSELRREPVTESGVPYAKRYWTAAEDRAVLRFSPVEAARKTGRSLGAVHHRRALLASQS